jgi:phage/conjugal plasmid C-4 type zinc finger TraR family protein
MDEIDMAQSHWDLLLAAKINSLRLKAATADEAATDCEECGEEIPLARRKAVPGCTFCVKCQARMEARGW